MFLWITDGDVCQRRTRPFCRHRKGRCYMAKLRKMLGNVEDPEIVSLMRLIETQSRETLAKWAYGYARKAFLGIYEKEFEDDRRLRDLLSATEEYINSGRKLSELKPLIKEAGKAAKEAEEKPAAQAAARAIAAACGVAGTPTNALGFTFYGAAAVVYDREGLDESPRRYDELARIELSKMLKSLKEVSMADEQNPVKVNWYC